MRTFSSRDKVGVSPVVPSVTIYSTPPAITCSMTLASAGSSRDISALKGVTRATPVPDKVLIRLRMVCRYDFNDFWFRFAMMSLFRLFGMFIPETHFIKFFDAVVDTFFRCKLLQLLDGLNDTRLE